MGHVQFLQAFILKVTLHGVKLVHGVADRCAGGKNHATVSGDLDVYKRQELILKGTNQSFDTLTTDAVKKDYS